MLLFTEGFDWTTTIADLATYGKFLTQTNGSIGNTAGTLRFGSGSGNYMQSTTGNPSNSSLMKTIGSNLSAGVLGIAFRTAVDVTSYTKNIFVLFDTTSNVQMGVKQNADATFSIFRTTHATILGTSTFATTPNTWVYLELKWKISDSISTNDVILYADGVPIITLAATTDTKNTANAYATHYSLFGILPALTGATTAAFQADDHYFLDLTGSTNNAPLGPVRIQTLFPNGNGNTSGFTGSDGNSVNNYQQVDDPALAVSDYNDGTALNQKDTYTFTDTVTATSTVYGLCINFVATKTDTDPRAVVPVVRHSTTDYDGTPVTLSASAISYSQPYDTNPGTSSAWTKSDIDSAEFGLKVST